ncbi:MAG: TatD family hydrolase [Treponema sp.]|nr:TatD family hydrolase [Treponema sp.]
MMVTERGLDGAEILTQLANRDFKFGLDIGTRCDDLARRQDCVEKTICQMSDFSAAHKARQFMYFSAGIWPDVGEIHNREVAVKTLRQSILEASQSNDQDTLNRKIVAIGECGLDHHWNPSGADGRCESDFDEATYKGEKELFQMQLELAKEMKLPVIVHSRDAFEDSLDCLKNVGYHNGIIHCYSYGIEEARKFLDLGWHIAFGGGTTYTKKAKMEEMKDLLRFVPDDRFLCETDAPYLAPVPYRGQSNSPVLVEEVYKFIAEIRGLSPQSLSDLVDSNIQELFFGIRNKDI